MSNAKRVPSFIPFLGHGLAFGRDADSLMKKCQARYGDCFELKLGPKRASFLLDPRDYPAFIKQSKFLSSEDISLEIAQSVFGFDKKHMQQTLDVEHVNKLNQRFMSGDHLGPLTSRMQEKLEQILLDGRHGQGFDGSLLDYVLELIFTAGSDALFGDGVSTQEAYEAFITVDKHFPALVGGVPKWLLPGTKQAIVNLRKDLGKPRANQSQLLAERFTYFAANPQFRGGSEIAGSDSALLWAAQANTAVVAFFTLFFILRDPTLKARIEQEVRHAISQSTQTTATGTPLLSHETLDAMPCLDSCISETLRIISAPMPMRQATSDLEVALISGDTLQLKKGDFACIYPRHTHHHPEIFAKPTQFQWDRFMDGRDRPNSFSYRGTPLKFALLPFGVGASICPGRHFARNEFKIITALLLNWCDIQVHSRQMPALDKTRIGLGSFTPTSEVRFTLKRRH